MWLAPQDPPFFYCAIGQPTHVHKTHTRTPTYVPAYFKETAMAGCRDLEQLANNNDVFRNTQQWVAHVVAVL